MRYTWTVSPFEQDGKWGADWRTSELGAEGAPVYTGHVDAIFSEMTDARGHAAMHVARLEASFTPAPITVPTDATLVLTDDHLAEALAAHQARFTGGDGVTLGA